MKSRSFVAHFRGRAQRHPERIACTFLEDGTTESGVLTYAELDTAARRVAAHLQMLASPGDRALILLPSGLELVTALLGCLYAGLIAIPAYPYRPGGRRRLDGIQHDARPRVVFTSAARRPRWLGALQDVDVSRVLSAGAAEGWRDPGIDRETVAMLQYTSGATGSPKGVMLTHGNLLANAQAIAQACDHRDDSDFVGWMPLFHDMGLMGNVLQPLFLGARSILMPPQAFVERPVCWLQAITRYRAHTSGGPDFAYQHCLRHVGPEHDDSLDLRSWRIAFNGSERVQPETLDAFADRFASSGLRRAALYPCYGLAEATLFVCGGRGGDEPVVAGRDADAAADDHRGLVSVGRSWAETRVLIVDPATSRICTDGEVGEIWVAGANVAAGYWNAPDLTRQTFYAELPSHPGRYLRTGDLGLFRGGELFVTGRLKELIVVRGQNLSPHDVERTALMQMRATPHLRCVAVGLSREGEEQLVVLQEIERHLSTADREALARALRRAITAAHGVEPSTVALVGAGGLPLTTSGKLRRREAGVAFMAGRLPVLHVSGPIAFVPASTPRELFVRLAAASEHQRQTLVEEWLRDVLCQVLALPRSEVAADTAIATLGIDSLGAMQIQQAIAHDLGVHLALTALLDDRTVGQIVEVLLDTVLHTLPAPSAGDEEGKTIAQAPGTAATTRVDTATWGERALWYLHEQDPSSAGLHLAFGMRLASADDGAWVRRALHGLARRHPALRSRFAWLDGDLVRLTVANSDVPLTEITDAGAADTNLLGPSGGAPVACFEAEARRPFDLRREPPCRAALVRTPGGARHLVVTLHHIAADFWSLALLAEALEHASRHGGALPRPARSHGAGASADANDAGDSRAAMDAWRRTLWPLPPPLDVTDAPRPTSVPRAGGIESFALELTADDLQHAASRARCTPFTFLFAAFQLLLHDLSRQDDLIVGTATNGRTRARQMYDVGYLVNPVPVRSRIAGDTTVRDYVAEVRRSVLEALRYRDFPFADGVERLKVPWRPDRHPLFDAVFVFQQAPPALDALAALAVADADAEAHLGACGFRRVRGGPPPALYDIELTMTMSGGRVLGTCTYPTAMIARATCRQWIRRFEQLVTVLCTQPDARLSTILRREVPVAAARRGVHHAFERHAAERPEAAAVLYGETTWTYGMLEDRAQGLAARLRAAPNGVPDRIAVLLPRGPWQIAALFAILKVGSAFIGIDPQQPAPRGRHLCDEIAPAGLITDEATLARCDWAAALSPDARIVFSRGEMDAMAPDPRGRATGANPAGSAAADGPAYIAYTSGSTGVPKGIVQTHANVLQFVEWQRRAFDIGPGSRMAQLAAITFDVSYCEIFGALCMGAAVCVPSPADESSAARFAAWLRRSGVTIMQVVPTVFRHLTDDGTTLVAPPAQQSSRPSCPDLRDIIFVGESVPVPLARRLLASFGERPRLHTIYGPTEVIAASWGRIGDVDEPRTCIPLGRAIDGRMLRVIGADGHVCGPGETGEIHIVSRFLSPGYFRRPDDTQARFSTIDAVTGVRAYRTGDLACWTGDGELQFRGRVDNQIKRHGVRIELEEIEAVLRQCEEVRDCAISARPEPDGSIRLIAFLVAAADAATSRIAAQARTRLPAAMMPSAFRTLPALPRNAHGKIDRHALALMPEREEAEPPERSIGRSHDEPFGNSRVAAPFVDDCSPIERALAALWGELLGAPVVDRHESFFALGGHSLLALRAVTQIEARFGVEVPVAQFLDAPTIAGCAAAIETARAADQATAAAIDRVVREVELMSDEMVERLLRERAGTTRSRGTGHA